MPCFQTSFFRVFYAHIRRKKSQRRAKTNYQIQIEMKYGMNRAKHKKYILMMGNSVAQGGIWFFAFLQYFFIFFFSLISEDEIVIELQINDIANKILLTAEIKLC